MVILDIRIYWGHLPYRSSSFEVVFLWGHLLLRFSFIQFVFHWGYLTLRLSSIEFVFYWGCLLLRLSSIEVVFYCGCLPYRLSSIEVIFHWCCLVWYCFWQLYFKFRYFLSPKRRTFFLPFTEHLYSRSLPKNRRNRRISLKLTRMKKFYKTRSP